MIKDFVAIDFETANYKRNSACQIAIVTVKNNIIIDEFVSFILPPEKILPKFTDIHGITNDDVKYADNFIDIFNNSIKNRLINKQIIAHNSGFDKSVLLSTMQYYELYDENISWNWKCTMRLFKQLAYPGGLKFLCENFNIELNHHNAISDAKACAKLFIKYNELTNI